MMTLSENSRDSEQNLRWIAWEEKYRRNSTDVGSLRHPAHQEWGTLD